MTEYSRCLYLSKGLKVNRVTPDLRVFQVNQEQTDSLDTHGYATLIMLLVEVLVTTLLERPT